MASILWAGPSDCVLLPGLSGIEQPDQMCPGWAVFGYAPFANKRATRSSARFVTEPR